MNIPVFITVRTASTRLPNKCLLPLGDCKVIEHVIRRCKHADFRPIICTTTDKSDDILERIAMIEDVEFYRGNTNPQKRWMYCATEMGIFSFHAIDCDDPYFCPMEVERSYSYMNDLKLHCVLPTESSSVHALGMMGTCMSYREGETATLPEKGLPPRFRMTLDYEEDYWFLQTLSRRRCDWKTSRAAVENCAGDPLYFINLFRNKDWREKQCAETHMENTTVQNLDMSHPSLKKVEIS